VTTTSKARATITMPSDTELVITREFKAPRALLFEALSKPEHVKRWYGLRQLTMPVCEMDFRPGGKWRYVLHDTAHSMDHAFSGEYKDIDAPVRIVSSERYEAIPNSDYLATVTLEEAGGTTTLTSHLTYQSKAHRDGHVMSGMEAGMQETYERLDDLLASLGAHA
jgi:uncharacterized protein YndB with AHSA1/START domain